MVDAPSAYPLSWPFGWPRTPPGGRKPSQFRSTTKKQGADGSTYRQSDDIRLTDARERLADELEKLQASGIVLSTNVELRADGQPRASGSAPSDPGVAVYFKFRKRDMVLACDRWNTVAGNMAALAAHIGALRAQERWGVGTVEQAFTGYMAIAPADDWRAALNNPADLAAARAAWIAGVKAAGGDHNKTVALNAAMEQSRKEFA